MRKLLLSVIAIFTVTATFAQPNFTSSDMPTIGDHDTVMYLVYYPIENNLETETGNGYTWDFTSLLFSMYPTFFTTDTYREKEHFVSKEFPDATIEEYVYDGTAGDINLYSFRNDTLLIHRSGAVVAGLNCIPPLASIVFPIKFNNSSVIKSQYFVGDKPVADRTTTTSYDGFGTLKMPNNNTTKNVFRIKKVEKDSSYVSHGTILYTSYIWYEQGGNIPVLRLTYTGATNLYFVFGSKHKNSSTAINQINVLSEFDLYPNPTKGIVNISGLNLSSDKLSIFNSRGSNIINLKNCNNIDLSLFPKGIYFVRIAPENSSVTKKIVLQ